MRAVLVNWMNYTHLLLDLGTESLFKAVGLVDKVLSRKIISRSKFQLLGIASLFVSSKYEEVKSISLGKFMNNCSEVYTKVDLLQMES